MERWAPHPDPFFAAFYAVSDHGNVKRTARSAYRAVRLGPVSPYRNTSGHMMVRLSSQGLSRSFYVHRMVLLAFQGPPPAGSECRHLDGNPANNSLANLAWGTRAENMADLRRHRPSVVARALDAPAAAQIKAALARGESQKNLALRFGVSQVTISHIKTGKTWRDTTPAPTPTTEDDPLA